MILGRPNVGWVGTEGFSRRDVGDHGNLLRCARTAHIGARYASPDHSTSRAEPIAGSACV
jgi:hypothetical protein